MSDSHESETSSRSYEWWAEQILNWYLPVVDADETATLSVDRESLIAWTGDAQAAERLGAVVKSRLSSTGSFTPILRQVRHWESSGRPGAYPGLPLLALTVVAAGDMGESFHPNDFYHPFRRLLDPSDHEGGEPANFRAVIDPLWRSLDSWLDESLNGQRGRSSFKPPPHPRYVGYSLAQAVVRGPDRRLLRQFLEMALGEDDDGDLGISELRPVLAEWARRLGQRGRRLLRLAESPRLEGICESVLRQELDQVIAARGGGRARGEIRVLLGLLPFRLQLIATRPRDFPATLSCTGLDGTPITLESANEQWYLPLEMDIATVESLLSSGLRLGTPPYMFDLNPTTVFSLCVNDTWGAWVSTSRIIFGESHCLLVSEETRPEVQEFLVAEGIAATLRPSFTSALPGWALFENVRFDRRPLSDAPPDLAHALGARVGPTARLVGGLRVPPLQRRFLIGGEPLVRLPWAEGAIQGVELEHVGLTISLAPTVTGKSEAEVPLAGLGMAPGHYVLRAPGRSLSFELVDAVVDDLPRGICEVISEWGGHRVCGYVVNAEVSADRVPRTVPADHGDEVLLIGARDDEFAFAPEPAWLSERAGGLSWAVREIDAPFPVAWVIIERPRRAPVAIPQAPLEPERSTNGVVRWRTAIRDAVPGPMCSAQDQARLARFKAIARAGSRDRLRLHLPTLPRRPRL